MDHRQLRLTYTTLLAMQALITLITSIPRPAPEFNADQEHNLFILLMNILQQLLVLIASMSPPTNSQLSLRNRLFPNFHGHAFRGRDVFSSICQQRYLFWLNTGETPESLLNVVYQISPQLSILTRQGNLRQRMGRYKLNVINRVLLVFIWIKKYPHLDTLSLLFDVSPQTVRALLCQGILVLWRHFRQQVTWPSIREWNVMRNRWDQFPNALGCVDVTPHEIRIPSTEPQRIFYSGHRHFHLLNTQLVCDNEGHIRFLQTGFLGSTHDAQSFRLMEPIGPGLTLDFPADAFLLADKGYADIPPLLTPFRQVQMRRFGRRDKRRARRFNVELSRKRVKIEHIFKHVKDFNCISGIWRQERWLLPTVIELCVFLTERRISLFEEV